MLSLDLSETERPVIHVTIMKKKKRRDGVFEGNREEYLNLLGEAHFLARSTLGEKHDSLKIFQVNG